MRVVLFVVGLVLGALGSAAYFVLVEDDEPAAPPPQATATPSFEQRTRLSERITRDRAALADRNGIYLVGVTLEESCARVGLMNPTPANVAFVERTYAGACVATEPAVAEKQCASTSRPVTRDGAATVPDLQDLGLATAARVLVARGFTYTTSCLGDDDAERWAPATPADTLLRVSAQCPAAGERVRAGTEVALQARAILPGGFEHHVGALDRTATGTDSPCGDGRNPAG